MSDEILERYLQEMSLDEFVQWLETERKFSWKTVQTFWSRVDKNGPIPTYTPELGPCWIWTGPRFAGKRYGQMTTGEGAHVFAWRLANSQYSVPPDKPYILHRCDVPLCVRGAHLYAGTQEENMRDKRLRGRNSKISREQRLEILEYKGKMTSTELAKRYAIDPRTVFRIWKERSA